MPKKLFDLADEDVAILEAYRASHGLRSHVEAVRHLIRNTVEAGLAGRPKPTPQQLRDYVDRLARFTPADSKFSGMTALGEPLPERKPTLKRR